MLSVLQTVFFRPLERREIMTLPELSTIFPNLDDIFEMHCESNPFVTALVLFAALMNFGLFESALQMPSMTT